MGDRIEALQRAVRKIEEEARRNYNGKTYGFNVTNSGRIIVCERDVVTEVCAKYKEGLTVSPMLSSLRVWRDDKRKVLLFEETSVVDTNDVFGDVDAQGEDCPRQVTCGIPVIMKSGNVASLRFEGLPVDGVGVLTALSSSKNRVDNMWKLSCCQIDFSATVQRSVEYAERNISACKQDTILYEFKDFLTALREGLDKKKENPAYEIEDFYKRGWHW